MIISDVPSELAGHLAVALRRHRQWAAHQSIRLPAGFVLLEAAFTKGASQGQQGTPLMDLWEFRESRDMPPQLLTYESAAAVLSVSVRQVKRLVGDDKLTAVRVGGAVRIRTHDLDAYVANLPSNEAVA